MPHWKSRHSKGSIIPWINRVEYLHWPLHKKQLANLPHTPLTCNILPNPGYNNKLMPINSHITHQMNPPPPKSTQTYSQINYVCQNQHQGPCTDALHPYMLRPKPNHTIKWCQETNHIHPPQPWIQHKMLPVTIQLPVNIQSNCWLNPWRTNNPPPSSSTLDTT